MAHLGKSVLKTLALVGALAIATSAGAETKTWVGKTQGLASTAKNWSPEGVPVDGDDILFDATSATGNNCTWDIDIKPASWTQTADYVTASKWVGSVIFQTEFDEYDGTAAKFVEITGDVTLASGTWTHVKLGSNSTLRRYRLYMKVGGNMTIGSGAKVDVSMLGYTKLYSVVSGAATNASKVVAGTFAGCGGWSNDVDDPTVTGLLPYGSAIAPEEPGNSSGWALQGGGVIRLDVTGALTVDGEILSEATYTENVSTGGSIYLHARSISGSGRISANCNVTKASPTTTGCGGRVAVVLTGSGSDFSSFDPLTHITAVCTNTTSGALCVTPGTVYVETAADTANEGWLIVNGGTVNPKPLELACYGAAVAGYNGGTVHFSKISLLNGAKALVPEGVTLDIRNTTIEGSDSAASRKGFYLFGGTLIAPDDWTITDEILNRGGTIRTPKATFAAGSALTNDVGAADLSFTGDLTVNCAMGSVKYINGGTGPIAQPSALILSVASNMTIAADGVLDVTDKGYATRTGPSDGQNWSQTYGIHGGATEGNANEPYGSIRSPNEGGTASSINSGTYYGGGVVKLTVGGALTNNGVVRAAVRDTWYGSGGGSVNVRAGSLSGSGVFSADASETHQNNGSGGGRLAIALADAGADFSEFSGSISACGGYRGSNVGGAGTVWLKTGDQTEDEGTLVVANALSTLKPNTNARTPVGGAYMAADELAFGDVIVGSGAWLDLTANQEMTVFGDFINGSKFVANAGSTVRFAGAGTSCISGSVTVVNVACAVDGKRLKFADGATLKITGGADIAAATANPIVMYSDAGTSWTLDNSAVSITLEGVALSNCQATAALTVNNGIDLGGNSANISFVTISGSELLTWTGAADTNWNNPANWDLNRLPLAADKVAIPATAPRMPVTDVDLTVAELAVSNGASLAFSDRTLTVNGPVTASGSLVTAAGALLKVTGDCAITGTVVPDTLSVRLLGEAAQAFTANGQTFVSVLALAPQTAFAGDFAADTLMISDGTQAFAATFAANEKVTVDDFVVRGLSAQSCSLACATANATWKLAAPLAHVAAVTVSGSDASSGRTVYPAATVVNGGDNSNWAFDVTVAHWNGAWTPSAPTAESVVWIDTGATLTVTEAFEAAKLVVDRGATNKVQSTLAVTGDVIVGGLLELRVPGTVGADVVVVSGGTLTHAQNVNAEDYKLDLTVGGDVFVFKDAAIDVTGKGYSGGCDSGPGATPKVDNAVRPVSASYGGRGYTGSYDHLGHVTPDTEYSQACYGSILCPTNCGSCGAYIWTSKSFGGGAVRLTCAGTLTLEGAIVADASPASATCGGSGGSVWLTVGALAGTGVIRADGCDLEDYRVPTGGGGRVAVYLTDAASSFADFGGTIRAFGGPYNATVRGSAGTVYLQTAADVFGAGVLRVVNQTNTWYRLADDGTDLPGGLYSRSGETKRLRVEAANYGTVNLTADTFVKDISLLDTTARLKLNGHKLTIRSKRHAISPDDETCIVADGGTIEWVGSGFVLMVR